MDKKMTLGEFITAVKRIPENAQAELSREAYIKREIIKQEHVGILVCKDAAKAVVAVSSFDKDGNYVSDGVKYHLMYVAMLLNTFTNLEDVQENFWIEYDRMVEGNILDLLLSCIPEKELEQFNMVLEMVVSDTKQNYFNTQAVINRTFGRFYPIVNKFTSEMETFLDETTKEEVMEAIKKNLQ